MPDTPRARDGHPKALSRARDLVEPCLRGAVDRLEPDVRAVAAYHLGWRAADGSPAGGVGKRLRPALSVTACLAVGVPVEPALPAAAAVELVHNFSLLHDDVMDGDVERHHRPTAWAVFGVGPAILAGDALLALAVQLLAERAPAALPELLTATQRLIGGQAVDLALERQADVTLAACLAMEAGKTAALLGCATAIGALAAGAPAAQVDTLRAFGTELGVAFQIVDDLLGIYGNPEVTGKSAQSDLRSGKRSAPVVAALCAGNDAGRRLAELLADGAPADDDGVRLAAKLVEEAGGIGWAEREADTRLAAALAHLDRLRLGPATADLAALARFVTDRDH